jgi:hypothetical protein
VSPIIYTAASENSLAYVLDPGGYDSCKVKSSDPHLAAYRAIHYGITEYYNKWQKELDERQYDIGTETRIGEYWNDEKQEYEEKAIEQKGWQKVASPSAETKRPLPDAMEVRLSDPVVYQQLQNRRKFIGHKFFQRHWGLVMQQINNVQCKFTLIESGENPARRLLQ